MKSKLVLVALTFLMAVSVVRPQEMHKHEHEPAEKLGRVNFPISCGAAAQKEFNRAMALLHSFQYPEAEKAFLDVSANHPNCAMPYWGVAMSSYHPLWTAPNQAELKKGTDAIARAKVLGRGTPRERDYIGALETFYKDADKLNHGTRARAYEQAMKQLYLRYPLDDEAALFYALVLNERALTPDEKEYVENKKKAGAILNRVLRKQPAHPGVIHYLIHSYDVPGLAYLALPAARSYAKIAPSSPHALHMPSHIFTRLGFWQESVQSNLASAATAQRLQGQNHPGVTSKDHLHALDYLVYAYLQQAEDQKAKEIVDAAKILNQADEAVFQTAFAWTAIPARYALERRHWDEAAALELHPTSFPWQRFGYAAANLYFARAVGAARTGNINSARKDIEELASIQKALTGNQVGYDWATQVDIQRQAAAAWLARAEEHNDEALLLMRAAADLEDTTEKHPVTPGAILPAREMLGDLLLELNQSAQALKEYEAVLQDSPNRFNGLYGAARSAQLSGDKRKARAYYQKLVRLAVRSNDSRPEINKSRKYLAKR